MLFHTFTHCQFSFPTLLEPMHFHEQTLGVPYVAMGPCGEWTDPAPYYFMPRVYLDDPWVWMIGRTYWGFNKEMATVNVGETCYTISSPTGAPMARLAWNGSGGEARAAIYGYQDFDALRSMLSQPLISFLLSAAGPVPVLTDFDRNWNLATVRRIHPVLEILPCYQHGFEGEFREIPGEEERTGPALVGAYELSGPWWLSFPYPPQPISVGCQAL